MIKKDKEASPRSPEKSNSKSLSPSPRKIDVSEE